DQAIAALRAAIRINPNLAEAHSNLGTTLRDRGQLDEAISAYRTALQLKPDYVDAHSNLLLTLNCEPRSDHGLRVEHEEWARQHAARFYPSRPEFKNERTADRKLRIGYVSPDFRRHSVAFFFEPVLAGHDRGKFDVFCYSNVLRPDDVTES